MKTFMLQVSCMDMQCATAAAAGRCTTMMANACGLQDKRGHVYAVVALSGTVVDLKRACYCLPCLSAEVVPCCGVSCAAASRAQCSLITMPCTQCCQCG